MLKNVGLKRRKGTFYFVSIVYNLICLAYEDSLLFIGWFA